MWPFRKKALTATPAVLDAISERAWTPYPLLGGGSRQRILDVYNTAKSANYAWMYRRSPAVNSATVNGQAATGHSSDGFMAARRQPAAQVLLHKLLGGQARRH